MSGSGHRLEVDGIGVRIDDATLLEEVRVGFAEGRLTGLLGPNGAGKTTLLRVAAGLHRPTTGMVRVAGADLYRTRVRDRARLVAFMEQESRTDVPLTVAQVVDLGRTPHRGRWPSVPDEREQWVVADAVGRTDIGHLLDRSWATLSGGERQRVQLARALAQEPRVLLLDEPTNHLDLRHQLAFLQTVRSLDVTVVAALHDLELAAAFCDDIALLAGGRLVAHGPTAEVLTASTIADVYGVDVSVQPHPLTGRPHVRWNGLVESSIEGEPVR